MKKVTLLRKKYPKFLYKSFRIKQIKKSLKIIFDFQIEPKIFLQSEIIINGVKKNKLKRVGERVLNNLVFHLGLIEMLNYWKLTSSPEIEIEAGALNREQIGFLKKIILKGMGQYFYQNQIDFTQKNFLKIKAKSERTEIVGKLAEASFRKCLIPIGGGKDSIVTLEILRKKGYQLGSFVLNPKEPQLKIIKIANLKENIFVERKLDPKLFKLNNIGFLNGHVPFSAFLAFLSLILAYLFGYQRIAFSWEKSASEPNVKYRGRWINHQWSKSLEFEKMFRNYTKKYLLKNVEIFSPLRKFSELKIAKIFSKLEKYHLAFLSCNNAYKIGAKKMKWCQKCPKCLFTFLILYPFLEEKKLIKIFGKDLFKEKKLLPIMEQLLGRKGFKPFECVGTKKEVLLALSLAKKKAKKKNQTCLGF